MRGKEKCKALKEIRSRIAKENDIEYAVSECTYQGECKGTCPKCEAELRYLEKELEIRKNLGKAVAVAGISLGACSTLTACAPVEAAVDFVFEKFGGYSTTEGVAPPPELSGDVMYVEPQDDPDSDYIEGDMAPVDLPEEGE